MLSAIKEKFHSVNWSSVKANKVLIAWLIFGTVAVVGPPIQWQIQRAKFYRQYGKYVAYEEQQRQYEEAQNQNNNNNDGYSYYSSYYKNCSSWNFRCRAKQEKYAQQYFGDNNNNNGGYDENGNPVADTQIPGWFQFMSGRSSQSEAMRRWQEENTGVRQEDDDDRNQGKATAGEIFVAVYMILVVLATVVYGTMRLYESGLHNIGKDRLTGLIVALVLVMNLLFLNLLLMPSLVSVEDRMMEESVYGWYGQIGVLMAYIDFYGLLFCAGFLAAFYFVFFRAGKAATTDPEKGEEFVAGDYVSA